MKDNLSQKLIEKYNIEITEEKDCSLTHGSFVKAYNQMKKSQLEKNNEKDIKNNAKKPAKTIIER